MGNGYLTPSYSNIVPNKNICETDEFKAMFDWKVSDFDTGYVRW
jgi:hypothetical protein